MLEPLSALNGIPTPRDNGATRDAATRYIRVGIVEAVYPADCAVAVTFPELSDLQSYRFPVLQPFAAGNLAYFMPEKGDHVYVITQPHAPSFGVVVGSFYPGNATPPIDKGPDVIHAKMKDGTYFEYDRETSVLLLSFADGGHFRYDSKNKTLSVKTPGQLNIEADGDINETTGQSHTTKAVETVHLEAQLVKVICELFSVTAPVSEFSGDVHVGDDCTVGNDLTVGGAAAIGGLTATGSLTIGGIPVILVGSFWKSSA